jgi:C1q domain
MSTKVIPALFIATAVLSGAPARALENTFDAASLQVSGQTQKFNGLADGTTAAVEFPVVYTNVGGRYSPSTHKYTAPANGVYIFTADVSFAMSEFGAGENQCELALSFIIENPDGSAVARVVASDIVMTPPGSYLPGGFKAMHPAGTMMRRISAGSKVSVSLDVSPGCIGEVHHYQGAHFSGGRM